jgi:hypothetical protein
MDALDECPNKYGFPSAREQVLDLIEGLVGLRLPSLHLCVISCPEVGVRTSLQPLASHLVSPLRKSGKKEDIAEYVRSVNFSNSISVTTGWRDEDKDQDALGELTAECKSFQGR